MQYAFSDEQEQLRDAVRRFLSDCSPPTEVRRLMATEQGYDARVWRQLCQDLALAGVHVPERHGGQGFSVVELAIVMEEMGRALLCAPYFASTVLAATAILNGGSEEDKNELLPAICAGERLATLAITEPNGRWDLDGIELDAANGRLRGVKSHVVDGCVADLLVVAARSGEGTVALRRGCYRRRDRPQATDGARCHPQAGAHRVQRRRRPLAGPRKRSRRGLDENATRCRHRAGQRNGGRRPAFAGVRGGVRQAASAIRTTHRLLPSREAPLRGTAVERRTGQIRRPTKPLARRPKTTKTPRRSPASPRPAPPMPSCKPPKTAFRFTAASASRGITTRTFGTSAPRARRRFWAMPPTTANC